MIEAFEGISAMECATRATNQMKLGATSENQYEAGRCSMITRLIHNSLSLSLSLLSLSLCTGSSPLESSNFLISTVL